MKIQLGQGALAIQIDSGASLPLTNRDDMPPLNRRGRVIQVENHVLLIFPHGHGEAVAKLDVERGEPVGSWHYIDNIDFVALHKERSQSLARVMR